MGHKIEICTNYNSKVEFGGKDFTECKKKRKLQNKSYKYKLYYEN